MSVKYNAVPKRDPRDLSAPPKYYPSVVKSGETGLRKLAKRIAEISTVSTIDTVANLEALLIVLPQELADGRIVKLGDFGTFWLRTKTQGSDTPDEVNAKNIINVLPRFTPGKEFKQVLDKINFKKA